MPHRSLQNVNLLAAALAAVLIATPAAAEPKERDDSKSRQATSGERYGETWHKRSSDAGKRKRLRYAQRRNFYSYPWTPWWGPFAGPPGL